MFDLPAHHSFAVNAGAECHRCPLLNCGAGPVPPDVTPTPMRFLVVGEAPSPLEVERGTTLIGPAGREIREALAAGGLPDGTANFTNAVLCRPPGGDVEAFNRQCKKSGQPTPAECCSPRLVREISRSAYVLAVGNHAVKAADIGSTAMKVRGTPVKIDVKRDCDVHSYVPAMATLHPAFVLRDSGRVMRSVFRHDVAKAVRLSMGGGTWTDPPYRVVNDRNELFDLLEHVSRRVLLSGESVAIDTETDGVDPWTCRIRRIGIGTAAGVLIYSPLSVHGHQMHGDHAVCREILATFFNKPINWVFHNFYGFDSIVMSCNGMPVNETNVFDSLTGHRIGPTSELPHKLDFLASIYTDAPRWKDDVKHSTTKSDEVLDKYLSFDIATTAICGPFVRTTLKASQQEDIYRVDEALSRIGRSMSAVGIGIDREKLAEYHKHYSGEAERMWHAFVVAAGRKVNPNSPKQIAQLLHDDLGLPIIDDHRTDTGEPGTGESVLLDLLERGVDERAAKVIHAILSFRAAFKIVSTYLEPPIHADGRLRTTWKPGAAKTGRWASGDPVNLTNVPDKIRDMYVPRPGNVFVAADYSALELRILALLASDTPLIEAFAAFDAGTGPDIHVVNCCAIFKTEPDKVNKEARTFAKRFVYGLGYGAGPPKIFQTMSLLRNDDFSPVFPGLSLSHIEHAYKAYWQAHPAITAWQKQLIAGWRRQGYLATPWHGRKRYFIGGENHEEMKNFPIQGGAADLQNNAVLTLTGLYPFDYSNSRGLILQVHDQLCIECAEDEAENVKAILAHSMTTQIGPMKFPAEVKIGRDWKSV